MVSVLWEGLEPIWGPARDLRMCQPVMLTTTPPRTSIDTSVRRVRPDELELLLPASVAMFTEEVGVSPMAGDGGVLYRARVRELVMA